MASYLVCYTTLTFRFGMCLPKPSFNPKCCCSSIRVAKKHSIFISPLIGGEEIPKKSTSRDRYNDINDGLKNTNIDDLPILCHLLDIKKYGLTRSDRMMPEDDTYGTWPLSGEIDIMESKGNDGET